MEKMIKMIISNNVFAIIKKILSVFFMFAIIFNVVVPKSAKLKEKFISAVNCVSEMAQTNFYDKYAESIVRVINGIASNILGALNLAGLAEEKISKAEQTTNKDEQKTEPVNTSADDCIITGNNTNTQSEINELKVKAINAVHLCNEDLNIKYGNLKINCGELSNNIGILFFVLFSILVVRIKDTIAVIYNNIVINRLG